MSNLIFLGGIQGSPKNDFLAFLSGKENRWLFENTSPKAYWVLPSGYDWLYYYMEISDDDLPFVILQYGIQNIEPITDMHEVLK